MAQKLIMVIDDSASLRNLVSAALQTAGYEVIEAADGADALAKLEARRVHLMVCDVNMPVMDGITFVRHVKQLPKHRFVPILMLTTESGEDSRLEGQMAGAKAWLVKPFRPEQLLQAVAKLILP
jgi:two-component system chemotaxis response regulator CheY